MISVTFQFPDALAASHALARMAAPEQFATAVSALPAPYQGAVDAGLAAGTVTPAGTVIEYHDRPDVGAPVAPPLPPLSTTPTPLADINAAAAFGGAVVQATPLVPPAAPPTPPTPPAAPSAPTVATAPTAVPGTVERDSTGLPWDARIHASTKTKVAGGAWTAKRNVDPTFKAQVEADLRGVPAPAPAAAAPVAPPVAPVAPVAPQAPAAPGAGPTTFAEMAAKLGEHFAGPNAALAQAACQNALAGQGLQHLGQLAGVPERIPAVWAEFTRLLG